MHRGRLLAVDTPEALRLGYDGQLVEVRAEDLPAARRLLAGLALARRTLVMGDHLMITVDDAGRAMPEIKAALAGAGLGEASLERAQPTLEDRFVQMIDERTGQGPAAGPGGQA
jgi:ABC-2 type transport system ATP-binding protein